jgi:hypothetical protein
MHQKLIQMLKSWDPQPSVVIPDSSVVQKQNENPAPYRLSMFQLVLGKQLDKLETELIHCLNIIAFVYR